MGIDYSIGVCCVVRPAASQVWCLDGSGRERVVEARYSVLCWCWCWWLVYVLSQCACASILIDRCVLDRFIHSLVITSEAWEAALEAEKEEEEGGKARGKAAAAGQCELGAEQEEAVGCVDRPWNGPFSGIFSMCLPQVLSRGATGPHPGWRIA